MRFPGTISVPEAAFETILEYAARSFKLHGFKDIVFLGDHGGYQANEKNVANKLNREWASSNVRAHAVTQYYDATQIDFVRILKGQGFTLSEIGTHAGLNDTSSLVLALDPSLVCEDRLFSGSKFGRSAEWSRPGFAARSSTSRKRYRSACSRVATSAAGSRSIQRIGSISLKHT